MIRKGAWSAPRAAEAITALLILAGFAALTRFFFVRGYLPAPFIFDTNDTFMDWFNTAYWAHNGDAYSVWRTIYLPLSFVITGALGDPRCYSNSAFDARACDQIGIAVILLTYVGCVAVTWMAFRRRDSSTALFRTIAMALGGPLLFSLERGNTIMLAYIGFVLLYGGLIEGKGRLAWAGAFLANMKLYFIPTLAALAVKRRWRTLELTGIAALALYLLSLLVVGEGTPMVLAENLRLWFGSFALSIWDQVVYSTTYQSYLLFDVLNYPVRDFVEQPTIDAVKAAIQYEVLASRGIALVCLLAAWFYPNAVSLRRLVFLILMQSFVAQNPGGYAILFITFLIFMERWSNPATAVAIICAYLVSIPADFPLATIMEAERTSWLSQRTVEVRYVLTLGSLLRPGLLAIALWALALDTLSAVHREVKAEPATPGLAPAVAAAA